MYYLKVIFNLIHLIADGMHEKFTEMVSHLPPLGGGDEERGLQQLLFQLILIKFSFHMNLQDCNLMLTFDFKLPVEKPHLHLLGVVLRGPYNNSYTECHSIPSTSFTHIHSSYCFVTTTPHLPTTVHTLQNFYPPQPNSPQPNQPRAVLVPEL